VSSLVWQRNACQIAERRSEQTARQSGCLTLRDMQVDIDERVRTVLRTLLDNAAKYSVPTSRPGQGSSVQ
jgi:hypothetical protein